MRSKSYLGPRAQIQPEELDRYEATKLYAAEEKHDGHWAEVITDGTGRIVSLTSRVNKTFEGSKVAGLIGLNLSVIDSTFAAELEAGTEAANLKNERTDQKRLHVFDVIRLLGHDVTQLPYEKRRELLEMALKQANSHALLVEQALSGFRSLFDAVSARGGEGLVLKKLGKTYSTSHADGKTDDWIRCKRFRYVDYVVMEIGRSEGGSANLQVGLIAGNALKRVATVKNLPVGLDYHSLVGRVVECRGAEVHASGALRHGHYVRARDDKPAAECTLEAALRA